MHRIEYKAAHIIRPVTQTNIHSVYRYSIAFQLNGILPTSAYVALGWQCFKS